MSSSKRKRYASSSESDPADSSPPSSKEDDDDNFHEGPWSSSRISSFNQTSSAYQNIQLPDLDNDEDDDIPEGVAGVPAASLAPFRENYSLLDIARRNRIQGDRPTEVEFQLFPELERSRPFTDAFLMIRNTALMIWNNNTINECTPEDVRNHLGFPYDAEIGIIHNVVLYLTRYGMINVGLYANKTDNINLLPKKFVAVIGAGAAGIAAATQLKSFGYDVLVVEATSMIGGRVKSFTTKSGEIVETGCDSLRNLDESPILSLLHQIPLTESIVPENSLIFLNGNYVPVQRVQLIHGLYRSIKDGMAHISHEPEQRSEDGMYLSRQQAYENFLSMVERNTLINYYNYAKEQADLYAQRNNLSQQLNNHRLVAQMAEEKIKSTPPEDKLMLRSLKKDIQIAVKKFDEALEKYDACEKRIAEIEKHPRCKQTMHPTDFRHYNVCLGYEEFITGAMLEKVQFSCNTTEFNSKGQVARIKEGLAQLFINVATERNIKVHYQHRVLDINTSASDTVVLKLRKPDGTVGFLHADYVVSTLPIGVLKKTIAGDTRAPTFTPPLTKKKAIAIRSLGNALVNKIVMIFQNRFWPDGVNQFVTVPNAIADRGAMFMWSSLPESNVLNTYYVGERKLHDSPDEQLISRALTMLRTVFKECPEPKNAFVTRWHNDEFAFGTGSFMSLRSEPHHFDDVAEPLKTRDGQQRVFFAGEHTTATEYGTLDGAWNSGLRAAALLTNKSLGVQFVSCRRDPTAPPFIP